MNCLPIDETPRTGRRSFLQHLGCGLAGPFFIRNLISAPPSEAVRLASFGADGMAFNTLRDIASHPSVRLVSVAEVDTSHLGKLTKQFPGGLVRTYQDWRRMLDKEHKNVDIACVGTPDHMHAPMAMSAMQLGLHVYVQKPLTHDIHEARKLAEYAKKKKLITQMGIQTHSSSGYQLAIHLIQSGAIGKVKEVHSWSYKKWGDPNPRPERSDPVPATLDWDQWLGTAAARPFLKGYYHPMEWRKRLDFGTGTFGDMGCHIYDPVFASLALSAPISVRSKGPAPNGDNWADNAVVHYVFPGTKFSEGKTVNVTWYDGDAKPPQDVLALLGARKAPDQGSIFIGAKGVLLLPHVNPPQPVLLPEADFKDFPMPKFESVSHYHQFVDAVLGKGQCVAPLSYAGPLTETVLLGGVATRFPQSTLAWDGKRMKFKNAPEANQYVARKYRKGWTVRGL
jgi:predicted dehydrogenase